jgi:hypothetical protein
VDIRRHKGIDIFAPKGTGVIAVADSIVSYIGEQPKGGASMRDDGERPVDSTTRISTAGLAGLFEGMEGAAAISAGFVSLLGNAKTTLRIAFAVNQRRDGEPLPDPGERRARATRRLEAAASLGTRPVRASLTHPTATPLSTPDSFRRARSS